MHVDPSGRQLRGRKPVTSYVDGGSEDDSTRPASRANRRQTIADFATVDPPEPKRDVSRRMSVASSVGSTTESHSISRASNAPPTRRSATPALTTSGVPVKKNKASTTTAAAAARIPKARPPVPRVPSNYMNKTIPSGEKEQEKESDMDQLVSRVQRVKLNMPSKEEYDAREKAKEAEKKAKATRKPPALRATKAAVKKAPGRPPKSTNSEAPLEQPSIPVSVPVPVPPVPAPVPVPEVSQVEVAAKAPLEQPQPTAPEAVPALVQKPNGFVSNREENSALSPRQSLGIVEPPTELIEMSITPEQLPVPPFVSSEPPLTISPPRPDTPPPPPPSCIPKFVHTNSQDFGIASLPSNVHKQPEQQWIAPKTEMPVTKVATNPAPAASVSAPIQPISSAGTRGTLPVFTSSGAIPFAPPSNNNAFAPQNYKVKTEEEEGKDLWEVPETPAR